MGRWGRWPVGGVEGRGVEGGRGEGKPCLLSLHKSPIFLIVIVDNFIFMFKAIFYGVLKMGELIYSFKPVSEIPKKQYMKRSKYDPILNEFLRNGYRIAEVNVEGIDASNLYLILKRRIERRGLPISIEVIDKRVYLSRI